MKDITLFPLLKPIFKFIGIIISSISLILLIFQQNARINFVNAFSIDQQSKLLFLLISVGLFITAFSREYVDDDRIKIIRGKSLQVGFGLLVSSILAFSFVSTIKPQVVLDNQNDLPLLVMIGLIVYLIIFNLSIYFDPKWVYMNENIGGDSRNKRVFFIVYFIIIALGYLFLTL